MPEAARAEPSAALGYARGAAAEAAGDLAADRLLSDVGYALLPGDRAGDAVADEPAEGARGFAAGEAADRVVAPGGVRAPVGEAERRFDRGDADELAEDHPAAEL